MQTLNSFEVQMANGKTCHYWQETDGVYSGEIVDEHGQTESAFSSRSTINEVHQWILAHDTGEL